MYWTCCDGLYGTMAGRMEHERKPLGYGTPQPREVLAYDRLKLLHPRREVTMPDVAREVSRSFNR